MKEILTDPETLTIALGLSDRQGIYQLERKGIIPKPKTNGNWDLVACSRKYILWKIESIKKQYSSKPKDTDLDEAKLRLTSLQADKLQMELKLREGELLEASEVVEEWSKLVQASKNKFLSLPTKLAAELAEITDPNVVKERLTEAVHECLQELAEQ